MKIPKFKHVMMVLIIGIFGAAYLEGKDIAILPLILFSIIFAIFSI